MYHEILTDEQKVLLPYLSKYNRSFYLVGGTAIALQIGHRRSIDFDLFSWTDLKKNRIKRSVSEIPFKKTFIFEDYDQLHYLINDVKLTFFYFPFIIEHKIKLNNLST